MRSVDPSNEILAKDYVKSTSWLKSSASRNAGLTSCITQCQSAYAIFELNGTHIAAIRRIFFAGDMNWSFKCIVVQLNYGIALHVSS